MIKITVVGAAGRMGRRLVAGITAAEDLTLTGALEHPECTLLGQDAGMLAGVGANGVLLDADPETAMREADAIIDFSTGDVVGNAAAAVEQGCSVVIGTTALTDADKAGLAGLAANGGRVVFAPNMSVGVNLLFHLCGEVAEILGDDYDIEVVETHHNQKKDSPSGTAVRIGEILADAIGGEYDELVTNGRSGMVGARPKREIGMHAVRGGDVVGDHTVIFATGGERVELTHKASSRDTFVKGALRAVRFLDSAASGLYDMQDVLGLK